jgi:NADH:ubiquinone oxidoreductase subunit 6 (subunit J)
MNKKVVMGLGVAAALLAVLALSVMATDWNEVRPDMNDSPGSIDFTGEMVEVTDPDTGEVTEKMDTNSLNYALFENYGPLLLILAVLMFGAMIGGVCMAREESEHDDTD